MPRKRLIIEISPNRFDAAVVRGSQIIARCDTSSHINCERDSLEQLLDHAKAPLEQFIASHGLKRTPTIVLYSSESASFGVFSCPASVGATRSIEAAQLGLEEASDVPLSQNPHRITLLCTDRHADNHDDSIPQKSHVFGLADSDEVADRICQWVRSLGAHVQALMPTKAVAMLAAIEHALAPGSNHTRIVLHMSDDTAVLAAAHNGSLRFVRTIGTGVNAFAAAMAGGMNRSQPEASANALSNIQAAELLLSMGIPESGQELDAALGITANDVLPFLQPIIQRCAVETKQSIRFGLSSDERARARFQMTGLGGQVPGLAELIARLAGVDCDTSSSESSETTSPIGAFLSLANPPPGLVSDSVRHALQLRRLQVAMTIGFVAATTFLGVDAYQTRDAIRIAEIQSQALEYRLASTEPIQQASQRLAESARRLQRIDQTYVNVSRGQTHWEAVLALFSNTAAENLTFSRMSMRQEDGNPVCSVNGEIRAESEQAARILFASLIDSLAAAPIVMHCAIASTSKDRSEPGVQRFELRLALKEQLKPNIALTLHDAHGEAGHTQ